MKAEELILEIEKLPLNDKLKIIEKTAHSVRVDRERKKMALAAKHLAGDYASDKELTAFMALDGNNSGNRMETKVSQCTLVRQD